MQLQLLIDGSTFTVPRLEPMLPERLHPDALADALTQGIDPSSITEDQPCGRSTFRLLTQGIVLEEVARVSGEIPEVTPVTPAGLTDVALSGLPQGQHGLFTTAVVGGFVEPFTRIERVVGIDTTPPVVSGLTAVGAAQPGEAAPDPAADAISTGLARVTFSVSDQRHLSGLAAVECQVPDVDATWFPCASGDIVTLPGVNGLSPIIVRATDVAANTRTATEDVRVQGLVPTITFSVDRAPDGNGFYRRPPDITMTVGPQAGIDPTLHPDTPFVYRVDSGLERPAGGRTRQHRTGLRPDR